MTLKDKQTLDTILKAGADKGQSIYHIVNSNPDIKCSARTIYRYVDKGQTLIQNIDLRRKVKLKPRNHYLYHDDNRAIRDGRRYQDFLAHIALTAPFTITEIDTLESSVDSSKCIFTIHFVSFRFMIGILLSSKSKENVSNAFLALQRDLGDELYSKLFPVILTDRGTEFADPLKIEFSELTGEKLTSVFFCDSYASYQKGAIEENHTLVRYIIPKGTSFEDLTQDKVNLMMSHINSYNRKSLSSSPYLLFKAFYGEEVLKKLKIEAINPDSVTLRSSLLK